MNKKQQRALKRQSFIEAQERMKFAMEHSVDEVLINLNTSKVGLDEDMVFDSEDEYGVNILDHKKETFWLIRLIQAFINPFTIILFALAILTLVTDVILEDGEKDLLTVIIILVMILISGLLRFIQETRSGNAARELSEMVENTTYVIRQHEKGEIPMDEVVVGDIISLSAGDMIPADMRVIEAKDLFISQAALTGESEPVEKTILPITESDVEPLQSNNLVFLGSNVVSGSAKAVIVSVGSDTVLGTISKSVMEKEDPTTFEKGVSDVSWTLIIFMLAMVPIVFLINGLGKGDWLEALLFSVSIAVGLTPQMLPMIVTTSLAKGAYEMSKKKTIVKSLNSIQNLGSMDILCTDKTGTLTKDKIILEMHLNIEGKEDTRVLRHGFLNSFYQTGLRNLMDLSIIERTYVLREKHENLQNLDTYFEKVDEVPFDFSRRRMSVVVKDKKGKTQMITKGAIEEMVSVSSFVEINGEVVPLTDEHIKFVYSKVNELNARGMRVLGVAQKTNPSPVGEFSVDDESEMVLMGYLAFMDPPKESAKTAIKALAEYGVTTKVLTGDNDVVTKAICEMIELDSKGVILGNEVDNMTDEELAVAVEEYNIFAKLSPTQKSRIIRRLRDNGHTVGFLGDGINDAPGMKAADIGISVDTAVDIAKESSDVILLEKDLLVLEQGIIEGRKTYANMIKYIKMTASSNFGNVFSILVASFFLPFLPMLGIQILLLNLIYDISMIAIPWDNVDKDYLKVPRKWEAKSIRQFMILLGPTSSIFDILTYVFMFIWIAPLMLGGIAYKHLAGTDQAYFIQIFQTGWFIVSMWTQTLVIHLIRSEKIPFVQTRASKSVTGLTFAGIILATILPLFPFAKDAFNLVPLHPLYYVLLAGIIIGYMGLVLLMKRIFINRYGELL